MTTRESKTEVEVSDVMPSRLRTRNRGPLVDRLKSYRRLHHYAGVNQDVLDHSRSGVGAFTILVAALEAAGNDAETRRAWAAVEAWADEFGLSII